MLASTFTRAPQGMHAARVNVETHLANGLPAFSIVGLAEAAVRESRDRVRAAIQNSQLEYPSKRITVNLAPADLPKVGAHYDLAIAVGVLAASAQIPMGALAQYEFVGELGLGGELRATKGVLPMALAVKEAGKILVVPSTNLPEASLVEGLTVYGADHITDVCAHLCGQYEIPICTSTTGHGGDTVVYPDMQEVKGQHHARRALEIAATGGHNILFVGTPGTGKTMLASRLAGILPPMSEHDAMETAAIQSVSVEGFKYDNWKRRPYRSPHHSVSGVALAGGGSVPQPGEISLAHRGVLFLDELTEFSRASLEVLREPMEKGKVLISRAARQAEFPADFQFIAAMNPCPCGYYGDTQKACRCTPDQIQRYQSKISGPLLDRIDMHINVPRIPIEKLRQSVNEQPESSQQIRSRVVRASQVQLQRMGCLNAKMGAALIEKHCALDEKCEQLLYQAVEKLGLSMRVYHRVLKVARTIADMANEKDIKVEHISEAIGYRQLDRG